jgi:hypothetical protein
VRAPTQSNSQLVAAYLDAVIRKDASAVERYFDPNVEYVVNGTPAPDPAGRCRPFPQNAAPRFPGWASTAVGRLSKASWRTCIGTWR